MMRRSGLTVLLIALAALAIVGTGFVAYGRGKTAGEQAATTDRSAFGQPRGTTIAGGQGAGNAGFGGQRTSAQNATGGQNTTTAASAVAGTVTKVDGGTLTVQEQPNNVAVTVTTSATTTVTTFAPGTLGDLAMGDVVALQGDKTGDTAYTAKTIFNLRGFAGGGAARAPSGSNGAQGTEAAGSPASGARNRAGGNASGGAASAPAGRAGGGLFPGLSGPTGRITKIDNGTLTLQGFDGATMTVTTNPSTSVRTQATGVVSDIKTGDTVSVQGDPAGETTYAARAVIDLGAAP